MRKHAGVSGFRLPEGGGKIMGAKYLLKFPNFWEDIQRKMEDGRELTLNS